MSGRLLIATAFAVHTLPARLVAADDRFTLDLETGAARQLRSVFAVPGDTGTLVRIDDDGPSLNGRATLDRNVTGRWSVRFLTALPSTDGDCIPEGHVPLPRTTVSAGRRIRVDGRFDSYRVSGVYRFRSSGPWWFRAGLTAKVHNAGISLRDDEVSATQCNTGVVPPLYGGMRDQASDRVAIDLDVDGAAAAECRAIDAPLRVGAGVAECTSLHLGGRLEAALRQA